MKIYMSFDMEGIAGTFNWEQDNRDKASVMKYMSNQLEWIIQGIKESPVNSKIEEIVVADSHSRCDNLPYSVTSFDERLYLISGGNRPQYMMPAFDNSYDIVFFVGYHSGIGKIYGNMDHTYSASCLHNIWINDKPMNESLINSAYAGYYSVPVGLVIGDAALKEELINDNTMPWVNYVTTKTAVSRYSAKFRPEAKVRNDTIESVKLTLNSDFSKIPLYRFEEPITLKVELASTSMADIVSVMPGIKRIDGRTVEYTNDDYKVILDAIMAVVYLAQASKVV